MAEDTAVQNSGGSKNDRLSLIDLFAVLLKYRRLIAAVTACGILAGGLCLVWQTRNARAIEAAIGTPAGGANPAEVYEARMTLAFNPLFLRTDMTGQLFGWLNSPELICLSLREAGYTELDLDRLKIAKAGVKTEISLLDGAEEAEALYIINRRFVQNQDLAGKALPDDDVVYRVVPGNTGAAPGSPNMAADVIFRCNWGTAPQAESFLLYLAENVSEEAGKYCFQYATDLAAWHKNAPPGGVSARDYVHGLWAKDFLEGHEMVLKVTVHPAVGVLRQYRNVPSSKRSPVLAGAVIVFASVFLAVFLAFALNVAGNIRADGEAMTKIRSALKTKK